MNLNLKFLIIDESFIQINSRNQLITAFDFLLATIMNMQTGLLGLFKFSMDFIYMRFAYDFDIKYCFQETFTS